MPDFNITIEGLDETVAMLEQAPRNVVARGYLKAAQAGGNVIADALEIETPVKKEDTGGLLDKGELRESLEVKVTLDSQFRGVVAEIGFGKNGFVANWLEYGHRILPHNPAPRNSKEYLASVKGFVAANPFMRKAADKSAEAAIDAFVESLKQTISEEFPQSSVA